MMIPNPLPKSNYPVNGLGVECYLSTSPNASDFVDGTWLNLNGKDIYTVAKGSFDNTSVQFRREEVTNPFVEGKYVVNALRENITTTLVIRVSGSRTYDVQVATKTLTDALSQVTYKMMVVVDGSKQLYNCYAADYTVQSPQELMHARMAVIEAHIPHSPVVVLSEDL